MREFVGKILGKYRIESELGAGGMATVYRAFQPGTERYVAIKVLHGDQIHQSGFVQRFQQEAAAVARLRHPNIMQVYDFDTDNGVHYMVMELIEGQTLEAKLANQKNQSTKTQSLDHDQTPALKPITQEKRSQLRIILDKRFSEEELRTLCFDMDIDYDNLGGKGQGDNARELVTFCWRRNRIGGVNGLIIWMQKARPNLDWTDFWESHDIPPNNVKETENGANSSDLWEETVTLFNALAEAIDYAHSQNIIHRDLKPGNIMFTKDGQVVLTDFGIAQIIGGNKHTDPGGVVGTYNYMAPEQLKGQQATPLSDIYSLGVILYEISTGNVPNDSSDLYQFFQHIDKLFPLPSTVNPDVPEIIDMVVSRALAKDPHERFSTAREMAEALRPVVRKDIVEGAIPPPFLAPRDIPNFVGRTQEIATLQEQLSQSGNGRVFCLTGMGGIGKTTLAIWIAHQLREHFRDGVLWADVKNSDLLSILDTWARAYHRDFSVLPDVSDRAAAMRNFLKDKQVLLILDDVWDAEKARELLPNGSNCVVLITTRDIYVTALLQVEPLPVPVLTPVESRRLFIDIVGQARMEKAHDLVGEVCELLGHLPLAVSIAASRMKVHRFWKIPDLLERLRDETYRLHALELRDFTVRAVFSLSWKMLNEQVKQTFALLGVFGGRSFTPAVIAEVGSMPLFSVRDHLDELESLSMVIGLREQRRYRQHPLLADYAREKLGEDTTVYARTARYYQGYTDIHRQNFIALEQESDNIQAGIYIARQQGLWQVSLDYAASLTSYWSAQGHYENASKGYETAVEAAEKLQDDVGLAKNLLYWGRVCIEQNKYNEGKVHLLRSLQTYNSLEDKAGMARAQYYLARIALEGEAEYDEALQLLTESHNIRQQLNDKKGVARTLYLEARVYYFTSKYEKTAELAENALSMQEEAGDERKSILTLNLLASTAVVQEQYEKAERYCFKTVHLCKKLGDKREEADINAVLVSMYRRQQRYDEAQTYAEITLRLFQDMGIRASEASILFEFSMIYEGQGQYNLALKLGLESLALSKKVEFFVLVAYIQIHLGDVYQAIGQADLAQQNWQEALTLGERLQNQTAIETAKERLRQ